MDLVLTPLRGDEPGEGRPLGEWLTTFHLATVVLDPYTNESSWILDTAMRILRELSGAAVRVNLLVTCSAPEARQYLGPLADEVLVFVDPDRTAVAALGLTELPAFALIRSDATVAAAAEGWNPPEWRAVAAAIADLTAWARPLVPLPVDPGPFRGTPALAGR
jgi:hypothetical protein